MLCLKEISGDERPSEIIPNTTHFWVCVYDFPFNQHTCEAAQAFRNKIGKFIEWDDNKEGSSGIF